MISRRNSLLVGVSFVFCLFEAARNVSLIEKTLHFPEEKNPFSVQLVEESCWFRPATSDSWCINQHVPHRGGYQCELRKAGQVVCT
jgi:hypothetical protein